MRQQLTLIAFFLILFILIDFYSLTGLLSLTNTYRDKWILLVVYGTLSFLGYYGFYKTMDLWQSDPLSRPTFVNFVSGFAFVLLVTKLVFVSLLLIQDVGRIFIGLVHQIFSLANQIDEPSSILPSRRRFLTLTSAAVAGIPFLSMLYGITRGKYRYTVNHVLLSFEDLPKAFEGFRLLQISDVHSGSWDDFEEVQRGIQMIQDQNADLIVFTGDLVNQDKDEINPFMNLFGTLRARYGKFAILGNHDYYGQPRDHAKRAFYWDDFFSKYKKMGFDLMLNENRTIKKEGEQIKLVGVENWGKGKWFPKKGDLDSALKGCSNEDFCILLSHDPSHWDEKVLPHSKNIHLTLSGHTHGMQFGVNLPQFKWSPIQYRYKRWIGLHEEKKQKLYINMGFGFLGFPGRVGMWPEITVFELKQNVA